jgi:A/G-specific adenine glycosylase
MNQTLNTLIHSLHTWYRSQARVLPWRDNPQPYKVWISEIMLQQTQVTAVIPFFERFMDRFPDAQSLAAASEDEVMQYWAGLGYYSRARNLRKSAGLIVARESFPDTKEDLLALPGIGPYTAGAILSIAYDQAVPILDANIERVISRIRLISGPRFKQVLWQGAEIVVKRAAALSIPPRDINQAMMELGALVCLRNPRCESCPVQAECKASQRDLQADYPAPRAKKVWKHIDEQVICLLNEKNQILIRKTPTGKWRAGLWDIYQADELPDFPDSLGVINSKAIVTDHKISRHTSITRSTNDIIIEGGLWISAYELLHDPQSPAIGGALRKSLPGILAFLESMR